MKRAALGLIALLVAAGSLALAGCPAEHDPFPDKSCKGNSDCFQGETCVMMVCTPLNDLASPDIALPIIDFSTPAGDS
ncbi:MAG TPA: hypothetical protein VFF06_15210 [Polyangia bacterium]|nr:hypothetical protein [Polyangia bacterium]